MKPREPKRKLRARAESGIRNPDRGPIAVRGIHDICKKITVRASSWGPKRRAVITKKRLRKRLIMKSFEELYNEVLASEELYSVPTIRC